MTHQIQERDFQKVCKGFHGDFAGSGLSTVRKEDILPKLETRLVSAAWTLRRLPDKERGFLNMRTMLWPEGTPEPGQYPSLDMSSFEAKWRVRISAKDIDDMQPTLDLLLLLPDLCDRRLVFWTCWHQNGEVQARVPWAKVRRSFGNSMSRWTMKRRYEGALMWLAALIALQA